MEQLFELIHLVNPTGTSLDETQRSEQYATKGSLQSLLIEQFGDALEVEGDALAEEGIISIRHRQSRRDACHARVQDLTPEARSWVRLQLDLATDHEGDAEPAPNPVRRANARASGPTASPGSADDFIRNGDLALAAFDFEGARSGFSEAVEAALQTGSIDGTVRAACRLLELLVDQLAETATALAWHQRLPPPVVADPTVRSLLALAAVRESNVSLAERLTAGLETQRAGEVHVELARAALSAGELETCARHLARVASSGEHSAAARGVLAALQAKRAEGAAALEQRLPELITAGQLEAAKALAREIVRIHENSEAARATLREVAQRERAERVAAAGAAVENELAAGLPERAARLLQADPALAAERPDLGAQAGAACARAKEHRWRARCDEIAAALAGPVTAAGVSAWWEADDRTRIEVRGRGQSHELSWLDELGPLAGRTPDRAAAAVALLVGLEQAADPERNPDPELLARLLEELRAHEGLLERSARARRLLQRARSNLAEHRRRAVPELLRRAEEMAAADPAAARACLDVISERDLDDGDRERLSALSDRIEGAQTLASQRVRFERCSDAGDLFGARAAAQSLAARSEGPESATWRAHAQRLAARIRAEWIRQTLDGRTVADGLADIRVRPWDAEASPWLLPGGRQLVLASAHGHWLFVRLLDLDDGATSSAIAVRTPEPMGSCRWQVDGATVWVTDDASHVLQLGLRPWNVLLWKCLREVRGLPDPVGHGVLVDSRHLWVRGKPPLPDADPRTYVVDTETWRIGRKIDCFTGTAVHGALPPRAAVQANIGLPVFLTDARGAPVWREEDYIDTSETAVVHPSGRGVLLVTSSFDDGEVDEDVERRLGLRDPEARAPGLRFEDSFAQKNQVVATSLDHEVTFLAYTGTWGSEQAACMVTVEAKGHRLAVLHRVRLERVPCLAHDPASRQVVALIPDGPHVRTVVLGREAPELGPIPDERFRLWLPAPDSLFSCRFLPEEIHADSRELTTRMEGLPEADLEGAITELLEQRSSSSELVALLLACPMDAAPAARAAVTERLEAWSHRGDPLARLGLAEHAVKSQQPERAVTFLAELDLALLPGAAQQHAQHLRGYCSMQLGDEIRAAEAFALAEAVGGEACWLEDWPELTAALAEPLDAPSRQPGGSRLHAVIRAIRAGDRALEAGDAAAAITILDCRIIWETDNVQALARLAEAYLGVESPDDSDRFRKRLALAALAAVHPAREGLQLGRSMWSRDRIEEVARRAREWLGD